MYTFVVEGSEANDQPKKKAHLDQDVDLVDDP